MVRPVTNTLIIRFSSVGDILLSSLLLRVFRKRFPRCRVDYLVKEEYADLVRHNPNLTNIIEFKDERGELGALRTRIADAGYDLIIDIHDSLRSRFLCIGRTNVVRINKRKLARFLLVRTGRNLYPRLGGAPPVAERYIEPVGHLGIENDGEGLEIFFTPEAERKAGDLLGNSSGPFIGVAPGAVHANKLWSSSGFAEAALALAADCGAGIVVFGSAKDGEQCRQVEGILRELRPGLTVINTAGMTRLTEAAALMDHCRLLLTNDSGLMHMASARKKNVVALFGPTVREFGFFPYGTDHVVLERNGLPCRPCTHIGLPYCPKGHFRCMNEITPDMVITAGRQLLARTA